LQEVGLIRLCFGFFAPPSLPNWLNLVAQIFKDDARQAYVAKQIIIDTRMLPTAEFGLE
jgi:hypothetical protein